jgi:hypothetical protein
MRLPSLDKRRSSIPADGIRRKNFADSGISGAKRVAFTFADA